MAENTLDVRLLHAYKSESEWNSSNPILKLGETGYVSDADAPNYGRYKIGDGSTAWKSLPWGDKVIWDAYNRIEIGGRNLITNSKAPHIWYCAYGTNRVHTISKSSESYTVNGITVTDLYKVGFVSGGTGDFRLSHTPIVGDDAISSNTVNLANRTYTFSIWVFSDTDTALNNFVTRTYNDSDQSSKVYTIPANTWTRISHTRTFSERTDLDGVRVRFVCAGTANVLFALAKLEEGNKATDWSPAPEDKADVSHTHSASDITSGTLSSSILPIIPVSKGGTGLSSLTSGQVLIGNGTNNITTRAIDTTTGGTSGSTSLITSGAVYSGLAGKANTHSHPYLKLDGSSQMTGDLKFAGVPSLYWNDGTWQQRIAITDDSTADTAVFSFQQSSNSGSNFTDLMVIRDNGKVIANTFVGALSGNANTATNISSQTPTLAVSNESNEITVKINANGSLGDGLLALRNALDFKWYGTHWQIGNLRGSGTDSVGFGFAYSADGTTYILKSRIDLNGNYVGNASTASKLQTARTIALTGSVTGSASFDGSGNITISTTTNHNHDGRYVYDKANVSGTMNDAAGYRNAMGMIHLSNPSSGTASYVNPNAQTGWHHFINMSYSEQSGSSMWQTQIANKAGSTDLWVRSRSGGAVSNDTAWVAPWTRILTGSNYTNVTDARYVKKSGDTMSGLLTIKDGNLLGIKLGSSYITAASTSNGEVVLQGGHLRFGESAWDYNQWAGLKYVHSSKTIYLGLADRSIFQANQAQSGGTILTPGVSKMCIGSNINSNIVLHSGNYTSYAANSNHSHAYFGGTEYKYSTSGGNESTWYKVFACSDTQTTAPSSAQYKACTVYGKITHAYGNYNQGSIAQSDFVAIFHAISGTSVVNSATLYLPKTFTADCIRIVHVGTNSWELQYRQTSAWQKCYIQFSFSNSMTFAQAYSPVAATNTNVIQNVSNASTLSGYNFLPAFGGTMTGALNFANGTWNTMGDDAYIGDCNQAGCIGIKGKNGATGIYFANYSGGTDQKISINGAGTMTITGTVASTFSGSLNGNATSATNATNITQTAVTASSYTNWRTLIWGASNSGTEGFTPSTVTGALYSTNTITCQPSTGTIRATTFKGNLSGNASTASKWATARTLTLTGSVTGSVSIDGSGNVTLATTTNHSHSYLPLSGGTMTGNILFSNSGTALRGIQGTIGDNDFWRVMGGATASNAGYLEIATADDANEPIYVRQYTGTFGTLSRTATLLDGSGNTSFPGTVNFSKYNITNGLGTNQIYSCLLYTSPSPRD